MRMGRRAWAGRSQDRWTPTTPPSTKAPARRHHRPIPLLRRAASVPTAPERVRSTRSEPLTVETPECHAVCAAGTHVATTTELRTAQRAVDGDECRRPHRWELDDEWTLGEMSEQVAAGRHRRTRRDAGEQCVDGCAAVQARQ